MLYVRGMDTFSGVKTLTWRYLSSFLSRATRKKEFAPSGSKFFSLRVAPVLEDYDTNEANFRLQKLSLFKKKHHHHQVYVFTLN